MDPVVRLFVVPYSRYEQDNGPVDPERVCFRMIAFTHGMPTLISRRLRKTLGSVMAWPDPAHLAKNGWSRAICGT